MPHALTDRQREYLDFIREFVRENESSPRLEDIANHFGVAAPTAHKMLEALQVKGYLYFGRDSISGFFIRLIQNAGSPETVIEVPVTGKVDRYGLLYDFPEKYHHFATLLAGSEPGNVFALAIMADIPKASLLAQDLLIFDMGRKPQPGDICILPFGDRFILAYVHSLTLDERTTALETALQYPVPDDLKDPNLQQLLNWNPIAYDEDTEAELLRLAAEHDVIPASFPRDWSVGVALRLTRHLSF